MLTIEKLQLLKTMPIFSHTKDETLFILASVVEERSIKSGESIIKKGALDTTMYMIVKGRVKIHDGDREIAQLGKEEFVGELAALVPEKRIASVSALEDSLLLCISHEVLYELLETQFELVKGIIHLLCQRLRSNLAVNSHN